ncbi:MAG: type I DNA topoisomerase [Psittacicella sp.]
MGGDESKFKRVIFNEITKKAIEEAFKSPLKLNMNIVHAQQTRRYLDRLVGFMVSPILWKKVARGLSAGRVQSVVTKLITEREREINKFIPKKYYELDLNIVYQGENLKFKLSKISNKKSFIEDDKSLSDLILKLQNNPPFEVSSSYSTKSSLKAKAPLITSTLQQISNIELNYSSKKTMMIAQKLYENGFITYMRTDSTHISEEAINSVRDYIKGEFKEYISADINIFTSRKNAQEAHEAIRPSNMNYTPSSLESKLTKEEFNIYGLIWNYFVASQMSEYKSRTCTLEINIDEYAFEYKYKIDEFIGWKSAFKTNLNIEKFDLSDRSIKYIDHSLTEHFTKPTPHYSESSLIKELEKLGIGRPSTYASIISVIQDRGYVHLENKKLVGQKIGEIVTDRLNHSFPKLLSYDFTAYMESILDLIADGKNNWILELDEFFESLTKSLDKAELSEEMGGMPENKTIIIKYPCKVCGRDMSIKNGSTGTFLSCTGYNDKENQCKNTESLTLLPGQKTQDIQNIKRCSKCNNTMDHFLINKETSIYICSTNPNCPNYKIVKDDYSAFFKEIFIDCDKCGAQMSLKQGRFGEYMQCSKCDNTRKILADGTVAPPKEKPVITNIKCTKSDNYFVIRDGANGVFLSAENFPKSRETRSILVKELKEYRDILPEKFLYLTEAPLKDPEGFDTFIRFHRKEKIQYISSLKNGKPTKYSLEYLDGSWKKAE